jgi:hypothetical protein
VQAKRTGPNMKEKSMDVPAQQLQMLCNATAALYVQQLQ